MKIFLAIEKEDADDCSWECPFRDNDNYMCRIFSQPLRSTNYGGIGATACEACVKFYNTKKEEGAK